MAPMKNTSTKLISFLCSVLLSVMSLTDVIAQVGIGVPAGEAPQATLDIRYDSAVSPGFLMPRVTALPSGEIVEGMLIIYCPGCTDTDGDGAINYEEGTYYVYVDNDGDGTLEWTPLSSNAGVVEIDEQAPSAPSILVASNPSSSTIDLSWTASTDNVGVSGYFIYYSDGTLATTAPSNSITVNGLNPSTSYTFYVTAYDAAMNESGQSNNATQVTTEITAVTINEGYFETGWDGWVAGGNKAKRKDDSNLACEQQWSVEIKHNKNESNIELRNVDLTDYTVVTVDFQYKTNNWNSLNDYFTFKLNGAVLGSFYESQTCTSASITINSSDYSFGNGDDFKFEGEMSGDGEKVYIDAVVIKGYTQPTATVCETSFEDDYGCWERDNNSTVWRGNWYPNTGQGHLYFQSDDLNNSSNFDNSYISTAAPIDASEFSAGMIQMWYSGNGNTEDENDNGTDYLRLQYYNGSGWSNFPEGSYGVQPSSYEFLSYSIPADYLTNNLRIRIKFDATTPNERLFVDDTVIQFY
jgi:hypothetical protein